tara:strand:- start:15145 stop:15462 length:318 start_codon:yes stop_codon:yes gene_type:complete
MAALKSVKFKIGNMRKEVDWTVYPPSRTASQDDPTLFVQSDKRALSINLKTKKGMLSNGKGHPGFASTQKFLGAVEVDVPDEIIEMCKDAQPQSGDTIGGIVRIA